MLSLECVKIELESLLYRIDKLKSEVKKIINEIEINEKLKEKLKENEK